MLSRWDPILRDHEDRRATEAPGATAVEWERSWARGSQCRAELNTMRSSVRAYIDTLSRIAGASAIADAVLSAPASVMFPKTTFPFDAPAPSVPKNVRPRLKMVRWLAPIEMFQTWRSGLGIGRSLKLIDELFVPSPDEEFGPTARFDAQPADSTQPGEDFWFDYIADMGDGFDGTAPVAWLVGRHGIDLPGRPIRRPPDAAQTDSRGANSWSSVATRCIRSRRRGPTKPRSSCRIGWGSSRTVRRVRHRHWWRSPATTTGSAVSGTSSRCSCRDGSSPATGRRCQSENWWHVKLPQGWWLWGIDTALDNKLVGTQREYFTKAGSRPEEG